MTIRIFLLKFSAWSIIFFILGFFTLPAIKYNYSGEVGRIAGNIDARLYFPVARATRGTTLDFVWRLWVDTHLYWCRTSKFCRVIDDNEKR